MTQLEPTSPSITVALDMNEVSLADLQHFIDTALGIEGIIKNTLVTVEKGQYNLTTLTTGTEYRERE